MILYIRFIFQEMSGPMHVAIYAVLRKGEKGKILQSLATDGYPEEIVRLTDKYGKCAVVSFEGNPVIGRNYSEKDPVIREIVADSEKFMTYSYTNSKGENKFLFARKDIFTPALDILQEYRFVVIAQCLSDRVLQTEEEIEEFFHSEFKDKLSLPHIIRDGELLYKLTKSILLKCIRKIIVVVLIIFLLSHSVLYIQKRAYFEILDRLNGLQARNSQYEQRKDEEEKLVLSLGQGIFPTPSYIMNRLACFRPAGILFSKVVIEGEIIHLDGILYTGTPMNQNKGLADFSRSILQENYIEDAIVSSVNMIDDSTAIFSMDVNMKYHADDNC